MPYPPQPMADPYRMRPVPPGPLLPRDAMRGNVPVGPPPPIPSAGGPPMPSLAHLPPDQQELLSQVLKMTPAQIATLPPEVQAQVQMLKAVSFLSGNFSRC
jgi:cleavage stimulation factor subunit 2